MTYNIPYLDCSAVNSPTLLKIRITEFKDLLKFIISINFNQTLCITFLKSSYPKPMHNTNLCSLQSTIILFKNTWLKYYAYKFKQKILWNSLARDSTNSFFSSKYSKVFLFSFITHRIKKCSLSNLKGGSSSADD